MHSTGIPVAAVVAEDVYAAYDALDLIQVEYEPLPALPEPEGALAEGRARALPGRRRQSRAAPHPARGRRGGAPSRPPPTWSRSGSPRPASPAVALEPRSVLATFDRPTEELTMWVSCQAPFRIRAEVARLLELPESRVRVIAPDVGGGFGVKTGPYREDVLLAWLARRLARPVKWVATRREDQATTNQARGSVCEGELALDASGRITGLRARIASPLGSSLMNAAAGSPWNHARLLPGAYVVPACDITVSGAVTTTAPVAAYRGAGRPEACFYIERLIDTAARTMGLDPAELRRRNLIPPERFPFRTVTGQSYDSGDYPQALDRALAAADYAGLRREQAERRARGEIVGVGVVSYVEPCALGWESGVDPGRAVGQGHRDHRIERPRPGARDHVRPGRGRPPGRHAGRGRRCSTATRAPGPRASAPSAAAAWPSAAARWCAARSRCATRAAASRPGCSRRRAEDVIGVPGGFQVTGRAGQARDVEGGRHRGLRGRARRCRPATRRGSRPPCTSRPRPRCGATARSSALVSIARDTGTLRIERLVWVDDAGTIINPLLAEGQLLGSLAQGLGQALLEAIVYDGDGQLLTSTLMDYAIPRADDIPALTIEKMHTPSPRNPLGAKGLGEAGCIAIPPALVNAAVDALAPLRRHPPGHAAHSRAPLVRPSLGVRSYIPTFFRVWPDAASHENVGM